MAYPVRRRDPLGLERQLRQGPDCRRQRRGRRSRRLGSRLHLSSVRAHLIVDVTGLVRVAGTEVQARPTHPAARHPTRRGTGRVEAGERCGCSPAPVRSGSVINVTVTEAAAAGYLTVWPCGGAKPATSALNFVAGQTIANAALAPVSTSGYVCIDLERDDPSHRRPHRGARPAGHRGPDSTGSAVTDWALTQIGDVYAAMNPYRFGDSKYGKAWDCADGEATCSKVDTQGKTRTTTAGSYVYDCSGLVVAAWLRAGIDLVKLGASWTEPMLQKLPQVTRETAQVGDLVMFDFDPTDADPVDHVGHVHLTHRDGPRRYLCRRDVGGVPDDHQLEERQWRYCVRPPPDADGMARSTARARRAEHRRDRGRPEHRRPPRPVPARGRLPGAARRRAGSAGSMLIEHHRPVLAIVDVGLPGHRRVRGGAGASGPRSALPVLFLTARDGEIDRVLGLELGADDYVTKPFSPARWWHGCGRSSVGAPGVGRRGHRRSSRSARRSSSISAAGRCAARAAAVPFATQEFDLLAHSRPATRAWPSAASSCSTRCGDRTGYGDDRTVDVHVRQLRKKLGPDLPLATVWGVGYRLG